MGVLESPEATNNLQLVFSTVLTDKILHRPMGVISTKVDVKVMQNILKQHLEHLGKKDDSSFSGAFMYNR